MGKRPRKASGRRLQSAMEYLMTYGWAILVIAIVLGVLYSIGVFNGINTVPRAQPGSCQVYRPGGAGNGQNVNLVGTCGGELPEFVAQFNGQSSVVSVPDATLLDPASITETVWFVINTPSNNNRVLAKFSSTGEEYGMYYNNGGFGARLTTSGTGSAAYQTAATVNPGTWYFGTIVYNGQTNTYSIYLNGVLLTSTSSFFTGNLVPTTNPLTMGYSTFTGGYLNGQISNVQIYNVSLSQAEISALYNEGIGGAPVRPQNLIGWWPLNGNANDYSGNANNGQATAVHFISNWTSYYTGPGAP